MHFIKSGLICLAVLAAIPVYGQTGSFERTLNVSGTVDLEVATGSGSIDIRRGSGNRVEIRGRIRSGDSWWNWGRPSEDVVREIERNPPIEQSGQTIRIGKMTNRSWYENVSISYEITVPAQTNVRSHTGSGRQTIEGVDGRLEASTGSGGIVARNIRASALDMHAGSGHISVQGEQAGSWNLSTGSGGVDIDLPPNPSFDLNARTGSGGVNVGFPMTVQGRIGDRHSVYGKVGGGRYSMTVHTGSGPVRID